HALRRENTGPIVDLHPLIPPNSGLELEEGGNINNSGEIAGRAFPGGCDDIDACGHAFLLIPCIAGQTCENESAAGITRQNSLTLQKFKSSRTQTQTNRVPALRARVLAHQRRW